MNSSAPEKVRFEVSTKAGLFGEFLAGNIGRRPVLVVVALLAVVQIVQVRRIVEEIRRDEGDHLRLAAAVVAQVEDMASTFPRKFIAADGGGPQLSGSANMLNLR